MGEVWKKGGLFVGQALFFCFFCFCEGVWDKGRQKGDRVTAIPEGGEQKGWLVSLAFWLFGEQGQVFRGSGGGINGQRQGCAFFFWGEDVVNFFQEEGEGILGEVCLAEGSFVVLEGVGGKAYTQGNNEKNAGKKGGIVGASLF